MLLYSAEAGLALRFDVVELLGFAPTEKLFKIFNKKNLFNLRESGVDVFQSQGPLGMPKKEPH